MFDYLQGSLAHLSQNLCVIDTHGIGWSLIVSAKTAASFSDSQKVRAYTYLNVGSADRASMELYGFSTKKEREFFLLLIAISGIGPKAAISILSVLDPEELTMCVLTGDAKAITAAPGIGLKGAQKIILELKDKVAKTSSPDSLPTAPSAQTRSDTAEAVNALVVLGYTPQVAASAVRAVAGQASNLQDLIRLALKSIGENER